MLFNFALENVIRNVLVNPEGLKLNDTHQLLIHVDAVNTFGESMYTIKKNREAFVVTSKDSGVKKNAKKTKYMIMYGDQNCGQGYNIKIGNK